MKSKSTVSCCLALKLSFYSDMVLRVLKQQVIHKCVYASIGLAIHPTIKKFLKTKWFLIYAFTCISCSHETKRRFLFGRKALTNLYSILKSRDIVLPKKICVVKTMVFPVVMHGCESWTIKKAGHWRIDVFEFWCWARFLRVPWRARRSNQSILKEINSEYSLEGLMLKLKLQYFGHLMWRYDSLEKTLMLGKIEGKRRGQQRMRWSLVWPPWWTWIWANSGR